MRIELPYETFTLDNGLRVFVHEDATVPLAAASVWYHVGSRNERPGRTGFAHLFEHLMFEGSAHVPEGRFDELLEEVGGANNGSTSADRTNYWITVPSHALELALWLESDRMGWLAEALTQEKLDAQRDVVMNERREHYDNRPYGLADERLLAALYPPGHPYSWPVIGSLEDLRAATLEDALAFFRRNYTPGNATLAIAGAVDAATVRHMVENHFAEIPPGQAVLPPAARPGRMDEERHVLLEDRVELPRVYLAWHSPPAFGAGDADLTVAAQALADGRASRLYRSLVHDRCIAQDVQASQDAGQLSSLFTVVITGTPDQPLEPLARAAREELARIGAEGLRQDELERVRNLLETSFVDALETVGGFGGKADQLNLYAFHTGDPGYMDRDLARYEATTSVSVAAAVERYLSRRPPVILSVVPEGGVSLAAGLAA